MVEHLNHGGDNNVGKPQGDNSGKDSSNAFADQLHQLQGKPDAGVKASDSQPTEQAKAGDAKAPSNDRATEVASKADVQAPLDVSKEGAAVQERFDPNKSHAQRMDESQKAIDTHMGNVTTKEGQDFVKQALAESVAHYQQRGVDLNPLLSKH